MNNSFAQTEPEREICTVTRSMIATVLPQLWRPLLVFGLFYGFCYGAVYLSTVFPVLLDSYLWQVVYKAQTASWFVPLALCVIFPLWLLPEMFYAKASMTLTLTTHRIIYRHGVALTSTHELSLSRISGLEVEQSPMAQLFGYGTVTIHGVGDVLVIPDIKNVQAFYAQLDDAKEGQSR